MFVCVCVCDSYLAISMCSKKVKLDVKVQISNYIGQNLDLTRFAVDAQMY